MVGKRILFEQLQRRCRKNNRLFSSVAIKKNFKFPSILPIRENIFSPIHKINILDEMTMTVKLIKKYKLVRVMPY